MKPRVRVVVTRKLPPAVEARLVRDYEAVLNADDRTIAAQELIEKHSDYFMCQQFENPANPDVHRKTTALEILEATDGTLQVVPKLA